MLWTTLVVLGLVVAEASLVAGAAVKSGSAYSGVTIAIHKEVEENPVLIENIKRQFTQASRLLYEATGGWAYFKDIVIAVPDTWKQSPAYTTVYSDPYAKAEFRVEKTNEAYGEVPYTLQPGACGEPGVYVHLTPEFILHNDAFVFNAYGPRDRLLVHEWSHLRYGIFDEYGTPGDTKFPLYYFDDGMMNVNLCSGDIKGWMESDEGSICSVFEDHVTKDCIFVPDLTDESTRSSLMSLHYLPNVDRFCTSENGSKLGHNWQAPSKQNLLCQRRGAWEVISAHPDFSVQKNTGEAFSDPTFRVIRVQQLAPRYVFVLDISSSMSGRPLELMKEATIWFMNNLLKDDSYVGVVLFNGGARVQQPLTKVNSATRRNILASVQSITNGGMTSIGAGVLAGINVLKAGNVPTEDALLIVLSDGGENSEPMISSVIHPAKNAKVKIHSVAFGQSADLKMEQMALATGGTSAMFQNIHGASTADLDQIFLTAVTAELDSEVQFIQLLNKPFKVTGGLTQTTVNLDSSLGKNVVFSLAGQVGQVDLDLESPSGKLFVTSSPEFTRTNNKLQYKFLTAETGKWKVNIRNRGGGGLTLDLSLISEPKSPQEKPIRVRSWIGESDKVSAQKGAKIFAEVRKGDQVVIRATVTAVVQSDKGRKVIVNLNDNGAGADSLKDDGTYTGFFTDFNPGERRYTVTAQVTNRGEAFIKSVRNSQAPFLTRRKLRVPSKLPPSSRFELNQFQVLTEDPYKDEPIGEKADEFDRTNNGGSFVVNDNSGTKVDRIKPSPVNDLDVVETGETKEGIKFMTLAWTSPGDDMDVGTPAKVEVRLSLQGKDFALDFRKGRLVDSKDVLEGNLTPQPGGTRQEVKLAVPKDLLDQTTPRKPFDVYVAVRATDKAGNVGDQGKVAVGHFGYEIPICSQPMGLFPRARHCNQFYHCSNGVPYIKTCPGHLHYSVQSRRCEWPCSARCDPKFQCAGPV